MDILWSERENQQDYCSNSNLHTARTLQCSAPQPLPTTSSSTSAAHHVQSHTVFVLLKMGVMMPKTCRESVDNKHLTFASCWFSLSLHNLLTTHSHRNLKLWTCSRHGEKQMAYVNKDTVIGGGGGGGKENTPLWREKKKKKKNIEGGIKKK